MWSSGFWNDTIHLFLIIINIYNIMHNDVGPGLSFLIYRNFCNCSKSRRKCILILEFFKTIILDLFKKCKNTWICLTMKKTGKMHIIATYISCVCKGIESKGDWFVTFLEISQPPEAFAYLFKKNIVIKKKFQNRPKDCKLRI